MDKLLQEDLLFQLHLASLISCMSCGQQKKYAVVMSKYHRVSAMKSEEAVKKLLASSGSNPLSGINGCPTMIIPVVLPVVLVWDLLPAGSPECPIHSRTCNTCTSKVKSRLSQTYRGLT